MSAQRPRDRSERGERDDSPEAPVSGPSPSGASRAPGAPAPSQADDPAPDRLAGEAPAAANIVREITDADEPPGATRADQAVNPSPQSGQDAYPPGYGDRTAPAPPPRLDRFGWPVPMGSQSPGNERRTPPANPGGAPREPFTGRDAGPGQGTPPTQTRPGAPSGRIPIGPPVATPPTGAYSGQLRMPLPSTPPVSSPPTGPYSGQIPLQPPPGQSGPLPTPRGGDQPVRRTGQFPAASQEQLTRSGAFAMPPDVTRSGSFAAPVPDSRSGESPSPTGTGAIRTSGRFPQVPAASGALPTVPGPVGGYQQSGPLPYGDVITGTGAQRALAPTVRPDSLVTDRPALAFLAVAALLGAAMVAYIALRFAHFPDHIPLHFGPAGATQPDRIGEKRELWTIPFLVGIVFATDAALAWAVYRYDRFAARLLTLGGALVAATAWVVLLTLLHR